MLDCIKEGKTFQPLSIPTHLPLKIDPIVLVERLINYQDSNETVFDINLELAIYACSLKNTEQALALAKNKLTGTLQTLMISLLDKCAIDQSLDPKLIRIISLTKDHTFCGNTQWRVTKYQVEKMSGFEVKQEDTHILRFSHPPFFNEVETTSNLEEDESGIEMSTLLHC